MRRTPVLIVGGGPAGAAAALVLARSGARPEVVERTSTEHDPVCGGFLSWRALSGLRRLGIDAHALGARPIYRVRICDGDHAVELELPGPAAGLSRRTLDAALLSTAQAAGALVARGQTARAADPEGRIVQLATGAQVAPDALFLATGKRDLRGLGRRVKRPRHETSVGLQAAVPVSAGRETALAGTVELHLFDEGYGGALLQEDGTANICLSVSQRRLSEAGGITRLMNELAREAPRLFEQIGPTLPKWNAIAGVPYGWRTLEPRRGVFRTGDQGLVSTSLFGDGLAVAISSGLSAADAFLSEGADAAAGWQRALSRRSKHSLVIGESLRTIAERQSGRALILRTLRLAPAFGRTAAHLTRTGT